MSPPDPTLKRQRTDGLEEAPLKSFGRPVSPPVLRRSSTTASSSAPLPDPDEDDALLDFFRTPVSQEETKDPKEPDQMPEVIDVDSLEANSPPLRDKGKGRAVDPKIWPSPFQLTKIRDLPETENVDTVHISDILGDVMLREVWVFNYCINIPWVMSQFDPDIRDHVHVNFVHGNWKREDPGRVMMDEACKQYAHAKSIPAYMPEMFGTHHSKILVLFRRDDHAQVIIHTANMIAFDWTNMTQGAWISPLLPLEADSKTTSAAIGSAFKRDFLAYCSFYGNSRTGPLVNELSKYSFEAVKAIFVGSVPGRRNIERGKWGWPALRKALSSIPCQKAGGSRSKIVAQCSSIATLGQKNTWLTPVFLKTLTTTSEYVEDSESQERPEGPEFAIIFPTVSDIKDSLNGYSSGSSVHTRLESAAQQKQHDYMRPLLYGWSASVPSSKGGSSADSSQPWRSAGRDCAAPHIKTYIRFSDSSLNRIDWALLTSANLSTQAWGGAPNNSETRVSSYEAGVLVHPGLWGNDVRMVPTFLKDTPEVDDTSTGAGIVGLRMPYSLPLSKYRASDEIWVKTRIYKEPDWLGQQWDG